jgi:hypothetical protein
VGVELQGGADRPVVNRPVVNRPVVNRPVVNRPGYEQGGVREAGIQRPGLGGIGPGEEYRVAAIQEAHRVEVRLAEQCAPVQTSVRGTMRAGGCQSSQYGAGCHPCALGDLSDDRLVGGSHSAGMNHSYQRDAGDRPDVADNAGIGSRHHLAGRTQQVQSAVAGRPGMSPGCETANCRMRSQRPPEGGAPGAAQPGQAGSGGGAGLQSRNRCRGRK